MARLDWRGEFEKALKAAAAKGGCDISGLKWEGCDTDRTWGDRVGLVFYGAAPEVNERAAKFFEAWAHKNLRKMGAVGGYDAQESIGYAGEFYFSRWANGAKNWCRVSKDTVLPVVGEGSVLSSGFHLKCEEVRLGHATSYVYYPCAD